MKLQQPTPTLTPAAKKVEPAKKPETISIRTSAKKTVKKISITSSEEESIKSSSEEEESSEEEKPKVKQAPVATVPAQSTFPSSSAKPKPDSKPKKTESLKQPVNEVSLLDLDCKFDYSKTNTVSNLQKKLSFF